jgi:hypothetical protein
MHCNNIFMRQILDNLLRNVRSKSLSRVIMRNEPLHTWIIEQTPSLPTDVKLTERVYTVLHGSGHAICASGQRRIFGTLEQGYKFCGPKTVCACARAEQSKKLKEHHAGLDEAEKRRRVEAAEETWVAIHGVKNVAQLSSVQEKIR